MQLNYSTNVIDTAVYEKFVCYNHKTKYTDWCPIPNDGGWGIRLRMWKPVKEVALKILNNGHVYITRSIITRFFPVDPDNRVIMESQCNNTYTWKRVTSLSASFNILNMFVLLVLRLFSMKYCFFNRLEETFKLFVNLLICPCQFLPTAEHRWRHCKHRAHMVAW